MTAPATPDRSPALHGGCLCGGVRYTYQGDLGGALGLATLCHCSQCRKAQGYACAAAPALASGFSLTQGEALITEYASSDDKVRVFCRRCGSPLYSRRISQPERLRLRLGSLDEAPLDFTVEAHIYCRDEPSWTPPAHAPRHDGVEPARS